jgi:hypothetical protein
MLDLNKLNVRNVKTFASPDGGGFNCTLTYEGKKIASVHDDGNCGCHEYFWDTGCQHFHMELEAAADALPPVIYRDTSLNKDLDWVVSDLVQAVEAEAVERRACKKGLCYQKDGDDKGRFWVTTMPDTPANREVCQKAGAVTFINDKYPDIKTPTPEDAQAKRIKAACQKGLCWRKNKDDSDTLFIKGFLDTPMNRAKVLVSYPNAIFMNDTYK